MYLPPDSGEFILSTMEKTLWQLRDSIRESMHSYEITDDSVLEPEIIEDKIIDIRSSIIADESRQGILDAGYFQMIENVEVVIHVPDDVAENQARQGCSAHGCLLDA